MNKKLILIFLVLFFINSVLALPIYVKPVDGSGNLQPNTAFSYTFNFTTNIDCSGVVLTNTSTITTGKDGIGFIDINISGIYPAPSFVCEYKDGALRANHTLSDQVFRDVTGKTGFFNYLGNITARVVSLFVRDVNINQTLTLTGDFIVNNTVMYVNATSGNVGIGNSSSEAELTVSKNKDSYTDILISNTMDGVNSQPRVVLTSSDGSLYIGKTSSSFPDWGGDSYMVDGSNDIRVFTNYDLKMFAGGKEVVRIKNSGNVGIGTTSPSVKLDVNGSINMSGSGAAFIFPDGTSMTTASVGFNATWNQSWADTLYANITSPAYFNSTAGTYTLYVNTTAASYARFINTSAIGYAKYLNTTAASYTNAKDVVFNNSMAAYVIYVNSTAGTYTLYVNTTAAGFAIYVNSTAASYTRYVNATMKGYVDAQISGVTTDLSNVALLNQSNAFGEFNQSFNGSTLYVDASTGRVGIGTTTPSEELEVNKNQNEVTRFIINNPNSGAGAFKEISFYEGTNEQSYVGVASSGNAIEPHRMFIWNSENARIQFGTNDQERMVIEGDGDVVINNSNLFVNATSGKVGIGTASPSAKLDVNGEIRISSGDWLYFTTAGGIAAWGDLSLFYWDGGDWAEGITLKDTSGNVGIGTTSPTDELNVVGDINVTGQVKMDNQNVTNLDCITFNSGGKICSGV